MPNPVHEVVRVRDGKKLVAGSVRVILEGWTFFPVKSGSEIKLDIRYNSDYYSYPPRWVREKAKKILITLLSEIRQPSEKGDFDA
ncbi:MAG: hypothetical protein PHF44_03915 [Candidatus Pacebacteria bacterium]|nr:hypothetical protein [Candidatus Paceibacterota bacterium]